MNQFNIVSTTRPLLEFIRKQQENQKFMRSMEIGATFFLISFFLIFAIRPTITTISALVGEIKSKEIMSSQMRAKINNVVQAQDNFSQVQERYGAIQSSLPDSPRFANIATQMRGVGQNTSLNLDKINFNLKDTVTDNKSPPLGNTNVNSYSLSFNTKTAYSNISDFLTRIFRNRRLFNLNYITLTNPETLPGAEASPSSAGAVNVNFSTNVFYWNQSK